MKLYCSVSSMFYIWDAMKILFSGLVFNVFLFCVLLLYVWVSLILVLDSFLLRSSWRSCFRHWLGILLPHLCIEFQGLISPWYPTLTTMSTHTLYQLSYIPSPTAHYLLITSTHVCVPVRKINFSKCIYIHFLTFSKSPLISWWGHEATV